MEHYKEITHTIDYGLAQIIAKERMVDNIRGNKDALKLRINFTENEKAYLNQQIVNELEVEINNVKEGIRTKVGDFAKELPENESRLAMEYLDERINGESEVSFEEYVEDKSKEKDPQLMLPSPVLAPPEQETISDTAKEPSQSRFTHIPIKEDIGVGIENIHQQEVPAVEEKAIEPEMAIEINSSSNRQIEMDKLVSEEMEWQNYPIPDDATKGKDIDYERD